MLFESWIAFTIAYAVLSAIPGPSVFMTIGQTLSRGRRAAFACILGDLAGGWVLIAASWLGLGAVLATSGLAFAALKWAGVGYLAWLGIRQVRAATRANPDMGPADANAQTGGSMGAGFLTGVLNPKAVLFYMAFLSQFIDQAAPHLPQLLILTVTASTVAGLILGVYAMLAAKAADRLRTPRARRRIGFAGGGCLIGGSLVMAASR